MATLPGVWHYRVSAGTGWLGVNILWLGEVDSLMCNFYFSVAAHKIIWADLSLKYTSMLLGRWATNEHLVLEIPKVMCRDITLWRSVSQCTFLGARHWICTFVSACFCDRNAFYVLVLIVHRCFWSAALLSYMLVWFQIIYLSLMFYQPVSVHSTCTAGWWQQKWMLVKYKVHTFNVELPLYLSYSKPAGHFRVLGESFFFLTHFLLYFPHSSHSLLI